MSRKPDVGTLDAMVQALDDELDAPAWEWLVASEDGFGEWERASQARSDADAFAELVLANPIAAAISSHARRLGGALRAFAVIVAGPTPATAMLGPTSASAMNLVADWGRITTIRVRVGFSVRFETDEVTWGLSRGGSPVLLSKGQSWRLETGEAPVMLFALQGAGGASFEKDREEAAAIAGVLVLEEATEERGET